MRLWPKRKLNVFGKKGYMALKIDHFCTPSARKIDRDHMLHFSILTFSVFSGIQRTVVSYDVKIINFKMVYEYFLLKQLLPSPW